MPARTVWEYTSIGSDGSDRKKSSDEKASTNAIGTPRMSPPKNPPNSKNRGLISYPGSIAFQPQIASDAATTAASVVQTVARGPASALAIPNRVMTRLPKTTGGTRMFCGRPNDVVCPLESTNSSQEERKSATETPTMIHWQS